VNRESRSALLQSAFLSLAPLIDGLLVALACWVAYYLRWDRWAMPQDYLFVLILGTALAVVMLPLSGAYQSWRGRTQVYTLAYAIPGLILVAVILAVIGTLTKTTAVYSRQWMGFWFLLSLFNLYLFRWVFAQLQRISSTATRNVAIVGDGDFAASVGRNIETGTGMSLRVVGFIADGRSTPSADLPGPVIGTLEDLQAVLSRAGSEIDEVWVAVNDIDKGHRESVQQVLQSTCLTVRFVPNMQMLGLFNHAPSEIAGMTVIDLNASPLEGHNILLKIAFDKCFAVLALVLLAPLMGLIAIAIKLDSPGPVIYRQRRHGWDGQVIEVMKFRSMFHSEPSPGPERQAVRNDPRVSTVGRVLRRFSLDELPQFFNVLRGDMSVVGPRPHPVAMNENYVGQVDAYMQRHRVKPGLTGWAQVHGLRGATDTLEKIRKRVEYDLYYIEHWSLWLDVKIILRTLVSVWSGRNAY